MNRDQLCQAHFSRAAYVYVRQSSAHQVLHHTESQRRQRALAQRAVDLGWTPDQVELIDDDQGQSGGRSKRRVGFDRLLSAIAVGQVGIVLALEVSRMSRGNRAWYHLLDICAVTSTLIADNEGLYDPRSYNDRLLLGLKGTMSEAELHVMNQRLVEAMRSKAARGELQCRLPAGYEWDAAGDIVQSADEQIRSALEHTFSLFDMHGTLGSVYRALLEAEVEVPVRDARSGSVCWKKPNPQYVVRLLKHPVYAGAYVWGRRQVEESLDEQQRTVKTVRERRADDWHVLIQNHHEGYISWAQFERNQRQIVANRNGEKGPGAARKGGSLLAGLVLCGCCGRRMNVSYHGARRSVRYLCNGGHPTRTGHCQSVGAMRLEKALEEQLLEALQPLALEAIAQASAAHVANREQQDRYWQQRVEKARYEVDLARRQYDAVDPDNRLVARELEKRWESALSALSHAQSEAAAHDHQGSVALSAKEHAELARYARNLAALWQAPTTGARDKKRIVRALIENVVVSKGASLCAQVHWSGGEVTTIELSAGRVGINRFVTDPQVVDQVRELAVRFADDQIAVILHHRGMRTAKGLTFRASHVTNLRRVYAIDGHTRARLDDEHIYSAHQAAQIFGVTQRTVETWLSLGLIRGSQLTAGAPWRIEITDADRARLCPQQAPRDWVTLKHAALALGVTQQTILNQLKRGELDGVRVRTGGRTAWRIRLQSTTCAGQQVLPI